MKNAQLSAKLAELMQAYAEIVEPLPVTPSNIDETVAMISCTPCFIKIQIAGKNIKTINCVRPFSDPDLPEYLENAIVALKMIHMIHESRGRKHE